MSEEIEIEINVKEKEKKFELTDLVRYFHNVRNSKGELVPIIGEDRLAVTAALAYFIRGYELYD